MPVFYEDSLGAKLAEKWNAFWSAGGSADDELIDYPAALEAAQAEANGLPPKTSCDKVTSDWVSVFGPIHFTATAEAAGFGPSLVTMPLDAEGIGYVWDPYPPESIPAGTRPYGEFSPRPFTLLVAPREVRRARELIRENAPNGFLPDIPETASSLPSAATAAMPEPPRVSSGGVPAWIGFGALLLVLAVLGIAVAVLTLGEAGN
jgi:hypothetical protein